MGGRKRGMPRCGTCYMKPMFCICEATAECKRDLSPKTKILLVCHHTEIRKTTNTGRLAELCLANTKIFIRGLPGATESLEDNFDPKSSLLLYPSKDSIDIRDVPIVENKTYTLIVPDGNWRQASKVAQREKCLATIPKVHIVDGGLTEYYLRTETKDGGLATFEAIMRAFKHLEGEACYYKLKSVFDLMVERTLLSRRGVVDPKIKLSSLRPL